MIGNLILAIGLSIGLGFSCLQPVHPDNPTNLLTGGYASLTAPVGIETYLGATLTNFVLNEDIDDNVTNPVLWLFNVGDEGQLSIEYSTPFISFDYYAYDKFNENPTCCFVLSCAKFDDYYYFTPYWRLVSYDNLLNNTLVFEILSSHDLEVEVYQGASDWNKVADLDVNTQYSFTYSNFLDNVDYTNVGALLLASGLTFRVNKNINAYWAFRCCTSFNNLSDTSTAYNDGYSSGYKDGLTDGENSGYQNGYNEGYQSGITISNMGDLGTLFGLIADVPIMMLRSVFNFDLFGMNVFIAIMSLLSGLVVLYVIKKII